MDEPWDLRKAEANLRKHGVSFDEAMTVEDDSFLWARADTRHSAAEDRRLLIGMSSTGRLLTVACTYRAGRMRPISARRATKRERHDYWFRHRRPR